MQITIPTIERFARGMRLLARAGEVGLNCFGGDDGSGSNYSNKEQKKASFVLHYQHHHHHKDLIVCGRGVGSVKRKKK